MVEYLVPMDADRITSAKYGAKGDGFTDDYAAIQKALIGTAPL